MRYQTPPSWDFQKRGRKKNCLLSYIFHLHIKRGFPGGSVVKNLPAKAGDSGSIPGSGKSPGEGNGNQLQYPWLKNSMVSGAWQATVHGVAKELDMTQ